MLAPAAAQEWMVLGPTWYSYTNVIYGGSGDGGGGDGGGDGSGDGSREIRN